MNAYPQPTFTHLIRLSDDTGLLKHARGAIPLHGHGYCVDDVARGLMVICREPRPTAELTALAERYLAFLIQAQAEDGTFHNRLSYQRAWLDPTGTGDWWERRDPSRNRLVPWRERLQSGARKLDHRRLRRRPARLRV